MAESVVRQPALARQPGDLGGSGLEEGGDLLGGEQGVFGAVGRGRDGWIE